MPGDRPAIARTFALVAISVLFVFLMAKYFLPSSPVLTRLYVLAAFFFAIGCGYLLGSLNRERRVWQLVNNLKIQIQNKESVQEKLLHGELRLERQKASLARLGTVRANAPGLTDYFKQIVSEAAKTLDVSRVSIWLFSPDKRLLVCEAMYHLNEMRYSAGQQLLALELPRYFAALAQERVIAAKNVYQHPALKEFTTSYFPENKISSMLDATIWLGSEVVGVICHEYIGGYREWTLDEQNYAASLSDLVSGSQEAHKRQQVESDLLTHQANLETIVKTRTEAIEGSAKLSRFLVSRAPVSILYMNKATEVIEMNPELELVSGYSRSFAAGKTFYELFSTKKIRAQHLALFKKILVGEKLQGYELLMRRADGVVSEYSISASMELDSNGEHVIIAIAQDMSQQKMVEAALQKAREAAESADRIKSMFVASMSHELRTPLNSIIGFLGVVMNGMSGEINSRQKDQLGRAYQSSKHLLALISDVIDISKIEAGYLQVYVEKFELLPLLLEVEHVVHHLADEKKIELSIVCEKGVMLETDRKRLYQSVLNLMSNAVKYTEEGAVHVRVEAQAEQIMIHVQDTGIGIDEKGLESLFKPFERVNSHLRIRTLGTGLGLYLTHKIMTQLLGGGVTVESRPEIGSTFTLTLPRSMSESPTEPITSILEDEKN